jgi:hypothetical protein
MRKPKTRAALRRLVDGPDTPEAVETFLREAT